MLEELRGEGGEVVGYAGAGGVVGLVAVGEKFKHCDGRCRWGGNLHVDSSHWAAELGA